MVMRLNGFGAVAQRIAGDGIKRAGSIPRFLFLREDHVKKLHQQRQDDRPDRDVCEELAGFVASVRGCMDE
jgi:hypothetical protein